VPLVGEGGRDARDVVVADERQRDERLQEVVVPLQRPGELVEVAVGERAPHGLPQLVLRDRVEPAPLDDVAVVAVEHLAHDVGVGMPRAHPR
jgi:hypothetical protein